LLETGVQALGARLVMGRRRQGVKIISEQLVEQIITQSCVFAICRYGVFKFLVIAAPLLGGNASGRHRAREQYRGGRTVGFGNDRRARLRRTFLAKRSCGWLGDSDQAFRTQHGYAGSEP
jgi:hypothetical protein